MAKNRLFPKRSKRSLAASFRQSGIAHLWSRLDSRVPHTSFRTTYVEYTGSYAFIDTFAKSWSSLALNCKTVKRNKFSFL